ncbi:MAG: LytTR family DNA-binding domain-containing protein [Pseudomonadota bacterium]
MQLTHRELQGTWGPLALLWVLLSLLCGLAGPFGTHDAMSLPARLGYWGLWVGVSILITRWISTRPITGWMQQALLWGGFTLGLAGAVTLVNRAVFPPPWGWAEFAYLIVTVGFTCGVINGVILMGLRYLGAPVAAAGTSVERFLRRLPLEVRGPLVRIEAQDHYLNVVTMKGEALILMRMGEALDELEDIAGLQVHRSHWVALDAVTAHRRKDGRDLLTLSDGSAVPVARSRRQAARDAGLF